MTHIVQRSPLFGSVACSNQFGDIDDRLNIFGSCQQLILDGKWRFISAKYRKKKAGIHELMLSTYSAERGEIMLSDSSGPGIGGSGMPA